MPNVFYGFQTCTHDLMRFFFLVYTLREKQIDFNTKNYFKNLKYKKEQILQIS